MFKHLIIYKKDSSKKNYVHVLLKIKNTYYKIFACN